MELFIGILFFICYAVLWWCLLSWLVDWFERNPDHKATRFFQKPVLWLAAQFRKIGRWMNGIVNRKARTRGQARRHDRH